MDSLLKRAKNVKLIAMDIDGVLTKGELILLDSGEEVKAWDIKDRLAYTLLKRSGLGIKLAWITGRESKQVSQRAVELKIDYLYQKMAEKLTPYNEILRESGLRPEQTAYIGDDWLDIPVLKRAGFSACPKNTPPEVSRYAHYVSPLDGGCGVLRDVVEIILKGQGAFDKVLALYDV
jgi:3-deoxy-D-manno-octulosonate 8-phosphate phosphatase (KDO 8-P phosphatase)